MFNYGFRTNGVRFSANLQAWISVIIYLLSLQDTAFSSRFHDVIGLGLPRNNENVNSNTICGNADGLTRRQYDMCIKNPEAVASAIQGLQIAVHECKRQFKHSRWNCSSMETRNKIPNTSRFFNTGFREAAYFHALSSAGVSYAVAHACSLGKIPGCECLAKKHAADAANYIDQQLRRNGGDRLNVDQAVLKYAWGNCDHDINFAMKFSRRFLDEGQSSSRDFYSRLTLHNTRVGRLIVANNMRTRCACHGTSGSCSIQTCWQETPTMQMVGATLKNLYASATKIPHDNRVHQNSIQSINPLRLMINEERGRRKVRSRELVRRYGIDIVSLVYWNTSPEYCESDSSINFKGTKGRFCNRDASSKNESSCSNLCCNRGYRTYQQARVEQCECRFHWCCRVECNNCTVVEKMSVCR